MLFLYLYSPFVSLITSIIRVFKHIYYVCIKWFIVYFCLYPCPLPLLFRFQWISLKGPETKSSRSSSNISLPFWSNTCFASFLPNISQDKANQGHAVTTLSLWFLYSPTCPSDLSEILWQANCTCGYIWAKVWWFLTYLSQFHCLEQDSFLHHEL